MRQFTHVAELQGLCDRIRAPNEERELALLGARCQGQLGAAQPADVLALFKRADALRPPERFGQFLQAARLRRPGLHTERFEWALAAALAVDAGAAAAQAPSPAGIPAAVDRAREQAIAASFRR